jgi:cell division protein FtsA
VRSISAAVKEAELMAGTTINNACVGVSGAHIQSFNSHGVVSIKRGQVSKHDVAAALDAAQAIPIPEGQQVLHVLPQYFVIDGRDTVQDPLGMHGIRLEVQAHIITGSVASVQNVIKCCQSAGIHVSDVILEQLASADAVLSKDERELGVAVLDIGGGTSDFAVYQNGSIRHTKVLPIAGNHFTHDLAIGLRTTKDEAERIKREFGDVGLCAEHMDDVILVADVQGKTAHQVTRRAIREIIEPRAQELIMLVHEEIISKKIGGFISTGMVLTGGGSLLTGMDELAAHILDIPVRIGTPYVEFALPESLNSPVYATGYGLLVHVLKKRHDITLGGVEQFSAKKVLDRMKSWVLDFF